MTILVDAAIWPWRGQRWAHLISDTSLEELHTFTADLGIRRLAFGGDHYDINTQERAAAVGAGAHPVDAREIVGALRRSGLRCRPPHSAWRWVRIGHFRDVRPASIDSLRHGVRSPEVGDEVHRAQWDAASALGQRLPANTVVEVAVLDRRDERAVVLSSVARPGVGGSVRSMTSDRVGLTHRMTHRGRVTTHELVASRPADADRSR